MSLLNSLELKLGRFAIPGLIRVVVALQALVYVLHAINPEYDGLLELHRDSVMAGQWWRVFTFLFIPPAMGLLGPLGIVLALMWLWFLGDGLEEAWGSFRLNVFYFTGVLTTVLVAFYIGAGTSAFLNLSLLFAFATLFPNYVIQLFLIIPLKIKWLAWVTFAFLVYSILATRSLALQLLLIASFANYLLFFGRELIAAARHRTKVAERRREFVQKQMPEEEALHVCEVCGRTEQSNPELDFRVAKDGHEYCTEHLPKSAPTISS